MSNLNTEMERKFLLLYLKTRKVLSYKKDICNVVLNYLDHFCV